ncbi:IstB-like ATP binding protein, partial [Mesorhizobium albiziae]
RKSPRPNADERRNGQSSLPRHPDNGHYEPSPPGVGKSWLACALGHKACREDFSVAYHRIPRLFATLALARGDGRYGRILKQLAKTDLLILDDWGPEKLNDDQRRDVLEIIEDRYERRSTIVTSQLPLDHWYEIIATQLWPMPSWTASFTTPIASISPVKACENSARQERLIQRKLDRKRNPIQTSTRPRISPKNGRLQIGTPAGMKSE